MARVAREWTELAYAQNASDRSVRLRAGGVLVVGRNAEDRDADGASAIRIRTCGRRGENLRRTNLQDPLRACGPGRRFHGNLCLEWIRPPDHCGEDDAARRSSRRQRGRTRRRSAALRPEPGLRRTRENATAPASQEAEGGAARGGTAAARRSARTTGVATAANIAVATRR